MLQQAPDFRSHASSPAASRGIDRDAISARSGTLLVRLAASEAEVRAAQALRYRIFYEEMKAKPSATMCRERRDFDSLDDAADHLLVIDTTQRHTSVVSRIFRTFPQATAPLVDIFSA
jgi:putative hemolysin